jgi:hypothetical protein
MQTSDPAEMMAVADRTQAWIDDMTCSGIFEPDACSGILHAIIRRVWERCGEPATIVDQLRTIADSIETHGREQPAGWATFATTTRRN